MFQKVIDKIFFLLLHLFHVYYKGLLKLKIGSHINKQYKSFLVGVWLMINFTGILIASPKLYLLHVVLSVYMGVGHCSVFKELTAFTRILITSKPDARLAKL